MSSTFGLEKPDPHIPIPPVEACDVSNPNKLAQYRGKRAKWLGLYEFRKDEPNNVEGQIIRMVFLDMSYRILTRPRRETPQEANIAARNGLLAHMLDIGYAATQVLAIRRLLDKRSDVSSLQRLLTDIRYNRTLITRENYVAHDGTPYDPNAWQSLPPTPESHIWGVEAPGFHRYMISNERHKVFDNLSGTTREQRSRTDLISERIFDTLQGWLRSVEAEKLLTLSHKFLLTLPIPTLLESSLTPAFCSAILRKLNEPLFVPKERLRMIFCSGASLGTWSPCSLSASLPH